MKKFTQYVFHSSGFRFPFILSILINVLLIGVLAYKLYPEFPGYFPSEDVPEEIRQYPLLSPRILQEYKNDTLINFLPLRKDIKETVMPWGESFGIYFEYLPTGISIGSNASLEFYTGSLVKVPIVMAFLQNVQKGEVDLQKRVVIEDRHANLSYGNLWKRVGESITLDEAVTYSLTESDNTASLILRDYVTNEDLIAVHNHLDIPFVVEQQQVILSAKEYASVLKALYFASILPYDQSQYVLDKLSQSIYKKQIVAGIPTGVKVAHKIGVLPGEMYSDCGNVYIPKRPYIVCMISGSDEATANERMKLISKKIYDYVSNANE